MAGHSKWANTRHRKAAQDAKRGKIFTKIIRELVTALSWAVAIRTLTRVCVRRWIKHCLTT